MGKKKLICEQCDKEFKWYRFRRLCNDCRVENRTKQNINYNRNKRRYDKAKERLGTTNFVGMNVARGSDGMYHVKGWQELERAKKYA